MISYPVTLHYSPHYPIGGVVLKIATHTILHLSEDVRRLNMGKQGSMSFTNLANGTSTSLCTFLKPLRVSISTSQSASEVSM